MIIVKRINPDISHGISYTILVTALAIMLAGGFQIISNISRYALWAVWIVVWICIAIEIFLKKNETLFFKNIFFIYWFLLYCIWGFIASPVRDLFQTFLQYFYFFTICASVGIITSSRARLSKFCELAQLGLIFNAFTVFLAFRIPAVENLLLANSATSFAQQVQSSRFGGIWGNPNLAGLATLYIIAISSFARPWLAWAGRMVGLLMIYWSVSRTAAWILVSFGALSFLIGLANIKKKYISLIIGIGFAVIIILIISTQYMGDFQEGFSASFIDRITDITESHTEELGGITRMAVLEDWLAYIGREPWYGYGLNALAGGIGPDGMTRTDLPPIGVHNQFLGILIDTGYLGFITYMLLFIAMTARTFTAVARSSRDASLQWSLLALMVTVTIFSMFNHNMLNSMINMVGFVLWMYLPLSPMALHVKDEASV